MIKLIKLFLRKMNKRAFLIFNKYEVHEYYFSQSGEDNILSNIFQKILENNQNGFYVDIGAFHPYRFSNTFYFYLRGWKGINVDATPNSMLLFEKHRKRDLNIEIGISEKGGDEELTFYSFGEDSMNSFKRNWLFQQGLNIEDSNSISVKTLTLNELFIKYLDFNQEIDFMNIDVEGMNTEVCQSNNWDNFRPNILVIELPGRELSEINDDINYFEGINYHLIGKTTLYSPCGSLIFQNGSYKI